MYCLLPYKYLTTPKALTISLMVFVQLEVIEQLVGYSEYDVTKCNQIDTVALNYPPSVFRTVGLVSFLQRLIS